MILFAFLSFTTTAYAQQQCTSDDTIGACFNRFNPTIAAAAQKISTTNTGTPSAATVQTSTALRDFLSFFSAAAEVGKVSDSGNTVTLDWNLPFPFFQKYGKLKAQTLLTDPDLAKDVQKALASNATALADSKSKLTNFDDVTALASYNFVSQSLGRSIGPHVDLLDALSHAATIDEDSNLRAVARFAGRLATISPNVNQDTKFSSITDLSTRQSLIAQVESIAQAEQKSAAASASVAKALAQLVNNQPQAYISVTYHARNELVGPDELSGKATYEVSPNNLNTFLKANADTCKLDVMKAELAAMDAASAPQSIGCLTRLSAAADPATQPDASDRFAFSIEYKQTRSGSVDLAAFSIAAPLLRPGVHSVVYSLTWGHPFATQVARDGRFDVAVNYDNVSNDATLHDRLVGSITYSQKLSDTLTLPLSLTYANHAAFLPKSERSLGVHFGLSYKIPDTSAK